MRKILLLSVPHTGTVFVQNYINDILRVPRLKDYKQFVSVDENVHINLHTVEANRVLANGASLHQNIIEYAEENCNVIIPIRNPIDNAISCLSRGHNSLDYCIGNWKEMLNEYSRFQNVFWIDVWTPEENRRTMMLKLNEFLDIQPEQKLFDDFVEQWPKVNQNANPKPFDLEKHDPTQLKFAVDWYNEKKLELDKLYLPLPTD